MRTLVQLTFWTCRAGSCSRSSPVTVYYRRTRFTFLWICRLSFFLWRFVRHSSNHYPKNPVEISRNSWRSQRSHPGSHLVHQGSHRLVVLGQRFNVYRMIYFTLSNWTVSSNWVISRQFLLKSVVIRQSHWLQFESYFETSNTWLKSPKTQATQANSDSRVTAHPLPLLPGGTSI